MAAIDVRGLSRDFEYYEKSAGIRGAVRNLFRRKREVRHAVSGISFQVPRGEIAGFLGPNGAGKTTTLKMLSGILHPTAGQATVNGFVPWERKDEFKRSFSFVSGQKSQLWPDLPAVDSLRLNRCIYEIPDAEYDRSLDELLELFGMRGLLRVQVRRLSLGERMKMEIIAALLHRPQVIFLDEPTIGLDILSQQSIRAFLKRYNRETDATIVLTSHYMKDVEELCDHVVVINEGKKVYDGSLDGIREAYGAAKVIRLVFSEAIAEGRLLKYGGSGIQCDGNRATLRVERESAGGCLNRMLDELPIENFTIEEVPIEQGLERLFGKRDD